MRHHLPRGAGILPNLLSIIFCNFASAESVGGPDLACYNGCQVNFNMCIAEAVDFDERMQCRREYNECAGTCEYRYSLEVNRYVNSPLTDADADTLFAGMTDILQTNDGSGDVSCLVRFSRRGDVATNDILIDSVNTRDEYDAFIALPGWIKIVNAINWCGTLRPNLLGCADIPGRSFVVVRDTAVANRERVLWAHEFGHNQGLGDNSTPNAVMNGTIDPRNRRVNTGECVAYRRGISRALVAQASPQPQAGQSRPNEIRGFVRQVFIHGVPYEEASSYDPSVIPTLLEMLSDPNEEPYWSNIVVTLGMIGDDRAVSPLISFINSGNQVVLSPDHYRAKTSAIMSLGYIINKTGNQTALDYLKAGLIPKTWTERNAVGIAPFQASIVERNRDLSTHAILALALSGRAEAAEALRSLQQPSTNDVIREFQTQVVDLISEALKEHQKVTAQGLENYYRTDRP